MSNKTETGRPLDAEELTNTQVQGVAGGKDVLDTHNQSDGKKVRFNSANVDASDGNIAGGKTVRLNSAYVNVSDRD